MKSFLKPLCLCLVCLLPLVIQAEPTGTIMFEHPENFSELWITNLENPDNARLIYKHTEGIYEIATQKDGPFIAYVADDSEPPFVTDVYLFDRKQPDVKARNLTQKRFDSVWYIDISEAGDVIFTNETVDGAPLPKVGIYLIPNSEIEKPVPKATLLVSEDDIFGISRAIWAPGGKIIAFDRGTRPSEIYTLDIETRNISKISDFGKYPTFSLDGKKLAFVGGEPGSRVIYITSHVNLDDTETIEIEEGKGCSHLKWTPDGQYIIYKTDTGFFAAPVNGDPHIRLSEDFNHLVWKKFRSPRWDWASPKGYPVEAKDKLTTLWGKLKQ